jgi:hypothetical protein
MSHFILGEARRGRGKEDEYEEDEEQSDGITDGEEEEDSDSSEFSEDSFIELSKEDRKRKERREKEKRHKEKQRAKLAEFVAEQEARVTQMMNGSKGKRKLVPLKEKKREKGSANMQQAAEDDHMVTVAITVTRGTTFCDVATIVSVPRARIKDILPRNNYRSTFKCSYRTNTVSKKSGAVQYPGIEYLFGRGHLENSRLGMFEYPYQRMVDTVYKDAVSLPWPNCHIFYRDMDDKEAEAASNK